MAALEKDPGDRIPGCQEFLRLLEQAGEDDAEEFDAATPVNHSDLWTRVPLIVGFLLAILFILLWFINQ